MSAPTTVKVENIPYSSSQLETERLLTTKVPAWLSITHGHGSATIEFRDHASATAAVNGLRGAVMSHTQCKHLLCSQCPVPYLITCRLCVAQAP